MPFTPSTRNPAPVCNLQLDLLGTPRLCRDGLDISGRIKYRKGLALLAYLAIHGGLWQPREKLAALLWPDLPLAAARTNLRQVLNNLTTLLNTPTGTGPLEKDDQAIRLQPGPGLQVDAQLLLQESAERPPEAPWLHDLTGGLAHLAGEFMAGLQLNNAGEFEDWLLAVRRDMAGRAASLLERLLQAHREAGHLAEALAPARLLVQLAPCDEARHLTLMTLLAEQGDLDGALAAFTLLERALKKEGGGPPGNALLRLRDELKHQLAERADGQPSPTLPQLPELRGLTALYCDFCLAPDSGMAADGEFMAALQELIHRRGGKVASTIGRGILAVFGLPPSLERSVERALIAAEEIRSGPARAMTPRMGICHGRMLYQGHATAPHLLGEIPDLAMLLGWSASPGETLVNGAVADQAGPDFAFRPAGNRTLPGMAAPLETFNLTGHRPPRPHQGVRNGLPFAGREGELGQLLALWDDARAGKSRIALIRAPAGMGKTRLAAELSRQVEIMGGQVRHIACRLELQHHPLAAVLASLEALAGIERHDGPSRRREKSEQVLAQAYPQLALEHREALAVLMAESAMGSSGIQAKRTAFSALLGLVDCLIERRPTLLVMDDLHWCDLTTLELLGQFVKSLGDRPVLLVLTGRAEMLADSPPTLTRRFDLPPLTPGEALALVAAADRSAHIPPEERQRIAGSCGGIPLFIERLAKDWLEGIDHRQPVEELLQSELDRLGPAKDVLRSAAVLGVSFSLELLRALLPDAPVQAALEAAIGQRLIVALDDDLYEFSHALIRDTAYQSLPPGQQQALHRHAAYLFLEAEAPQAEAVARHFSAGRCWKEAALWWNHAGSAAMAREFAADALRCFEEADKMLEAWDAPLADRQAVQIRRGYAAQMAQGFGSPLAHRLFSQVAEELGRHMPLEGSRRQTYFAALSGRYMGGSSQGEVEGLNIARQLASLAQTDIERLMASFALGNSLFWRGQLAEARIWQEKGTDLAGRLLPRDRIRYCVDDPAVTCRAFLGWNLWFMGEEAEACTVAAQSVALAREGGRTHALCFALTFSVAMHWCRDDVETVLAQASEGLSLARQYGLPLWESVNSLFLLWAQARLGVLEDNRPLFGAAAQMQLAYQAGITTSRWIAARALVAQAAWSEAEALIDVTIQEAVVNEDEYCIADVVWLKGECLLQREKPREARRHFARAEAMAEQQQALGLLQRFRLRKAQLQALPG
jgi:DNA-binding SARP family transcriptional activator